MRSTDPWMVPTGRGQETRETFPTHCPNGHALKPGNVLITGTCIYRWVLCRTCGLRYERMHGDADWTVTQQVAD